MERYHDDIEVYSRPVFPDREWPRYYTFIPYDWPSFMRVNSMDELRRAAK